MQEDPTKAEIEQNVVSKAEEQNPEAKSDGTYLAVAWRSIRILLNRTLRIQDNAHPQETIESIKNDIDFKGYNVWVLIFSILIASIGLNVNSGAVVIGAMLISPLMGPILGVGLSIGINDWLTMKRSLQNFVIMFSVSIITSFIYFSVTPLVDAQSELLARTRPTLLDVFVAFFGGLAGILAANRKIKTNVIPGVAIATALMPPLCTAGYGLATAQWNYFLGAFYLFLINSIFISLATFVIVRFLRFPVKDFVSPEKAKKARRYIITVLLIIVVPSAYTFYNVVVESYANRQIEDFIAQEVNYEGAELVKKEVVFTDDKAQIDLVFFGEPIPEPVIQNWRKKLFNAGIANASLNVVQPKNVDNMNSEEVVKLVDVFSKSRSEIEEKDRAIAELQRALKENEQERLPLDQLAEEIQINNPELLRLGMANMIEIDSNGVDTIMVARLYWREDLAEEIIKQKEQTVGRWLKVRLALDSLQLESTKMPFAKSDLNAKDQI